MERRPSMHCTRVHFCTHASEAIYRASDGGGGRAGAVSLACCVVVAVLLLREIPVVSATTKALTK